MNDVQKAFDELAAKGVTFEVPLYKPGDEAGLIHPRANIPPTRVKIERIHFRPLFVVSVHDNVKLTVESAELRSLEEESKDD